MKTPPGPKATCWPSPYPLVGDQLLLAKPSPSLPLLTVLTANSTYQVPALRANVARTPVATLAPTVVPVKLALLNVVATSSFGFQVTSGSDFTPPTLPH